MTRIEVDLFAAIDLTALEEETLFKLAEAGELKARRAGGTLYFLREEIDVLIKHMVANARKEVAL
jgi:hypothetical protein